MSVSQAMHSHQAFAWALDERTPIEGGGGEGWGSFRLEAFRLGGPLVWFE